MLQRTPHTLVYLTAAELGITERERAGLIEVRDDLASGKIVHAPDAVAFFNSSPIDAVRFNMSMWDIPTDCGTCHCIGGELKARGFLDKDDDDYELAPYGYLFYPVGIGRSWEKLTPAQAVRAIDHFLSGAGPDCWPMALSDIPPA